MTGVPFRFACGASKAAVIGRVREVEKIAALALYLASAGSGFITGQ